MAKKLSDVLAKLPQDVINSLPAEDRQVILAETLDPDTLLRKDMDMEDAATIILRIASLLSGTPVNADTGVDWSPELEALALLEDKKLVALMKKTLRLDCFKLRGTNEEKGKTSSKKQVKSDCPLP